jgi:hypothetical protein
MLPNHPHRALADLRGEGWGMLRHGSSLSRVRASENPGAVHIAELMAEWDASTDPEEVALIAQIRSHERDVRASYLEMEARLCPRP